MTNNTSSEHPKQTKLSYQKAILGAKLTDKEYRVLMALFAYSNADGEKAFPGYVNLARAVDCHRDTIARTLPKLIRKGWIVRTTEANNNPNRDWADVYKLTIPATHAEFEMKVKAKPSASKTHASASKTQASATPQTETYLDTDRDVSEPTETYLGTSPTGSLQQVLNIRLKDLGAAQAPTAPTITTKSFSTNGTWRTDPNQNAPTLIPEDWHPNHTHHVMASRLGIDIYDAEQCFYDGMDETEQHRRDWDRAFGAFLNAASEEREDIDYPCGHIEAVTIGREFEESRHQADAADVMRAQYA